MHYLLTVIGDTDNPADDSAPGAIDAFNDRLKDEGRWVFAGGLTDPKDATVSRFSPTGRSSSPRSSSPASGS
jgi:hypothetical protein